MFHMTLAHIEAFVDMALARHPQATFHVHPGEREIWCAFLQRHRRWGGRYSAWMRGHQVIVARPVP